MSCTDESGRINFEDFEKVDIRVGKIIDVQDFPRARKPSYRVKIDFGDAVGVRNSSLQAKSAYSMEEMLGRFVVCVINFEPKNIAGFLSEVLVLGVPHEDGGLSLLEPGRKPATLGAKVF
ncbi:MAG: tRNA-binding protein [Thermovirga sp.]